MDYSTIMSQVLILVGILVAFVNIITEVMKKTISWFETSKVINVFVTVLSIILTVATCTAYFQIKGLGITWYLVGAFIIIGFMVAYGAMYGFDKLIKYFEKTNN